MGRILTAAWAAEGRARPSRPIFASHLASVLTAMARDDRGIAWTALSLVEDDLDAGRLVRAGTAEHDVPIEIRLWRPKARQAPAAERAVDADPQVRGDLNSPAPSCGARIQRFDPGIGARSRRATITVRDRRSSRPGKSSAGGQWHNPGDFDAAPDAGSPVDHSALSPRQAQISVKMGRFGTADASNLMKTVLNYPEFARSIGRISTRVTLTGDLPPRLYQLACMRTVWLCDSEYLWGRHRQECLALGVTDAELREVASGGGGLKGLDKLVVEAIDEMHHNHYLTDVQWRGFDHFGHNAPMDLMTLYGFYVTMSGFAN